MKTLNFDLFRRQGMAMGDFVTYVSPFPREAIAGGDTIGRLVQPLLPVGSNPERSGR